MLHNRAHGLNHEVVATIEPDTSASLGSIRPRGIRPLIVYVQPLRRISVVGYETLFSERMNIRAKSGHL